MAAPSRLTIVGVFKHRRQVEQAMVQLREAGFRDEQLGIIARDEDVRQSIAPAGNGNAQVGAATGAMSGAGIGALWGLGIAIDLLPAIGPVIAGGAVAAILASAATGAAAGGMAGALIGLGIPEDEARYYESEVQGGRILLTVRTEDRPTLAATVIRRCGGDPEPHLVGAGDRGPVL
jgi:hypothetical protein